MTERALVGYLDTTGPEFVSHTTYLHSGGDPETLLPRLAELAQEMGGRDLGRILAGATPAPGTRKAVHGWTFIDPHTPDLSETSDEQLAQMVLDCDPAALAATYPHSPGGRDRVIPGFGGRLYDLKADTRARVPVDEPLLESLRAGMVGRCYLFTDQGELYFYTLHPEDETLTDACHALYSPDDFPELAEGHRGLLNRAR